MYPLIGQRLGQYKIISGLGEGGMATVYLARQSNKFNRDVAIKVIKPDVQRTNDIVKRLEREAETIAKLSHPHILKLFDFGEHRGNFYLVTEFMPGGTLADLIDKRTLNDEGAIRIIEQIASALDYAHTQGVIHRDIFAYPADLHCDSQRCGHGHARAAYADSDSHGQHHGHPDAFVDAFGDDFPVGDGFPNIND